MQASHDAHGTVLDSLEDALTSHEIKSAPSLVRVVKCAYIQLCPFLPETELSCHAMEPSTEFNGLFVGRSTPPRVWDSNPPLHRKWSHCKHVECVARWCCVCLCPRVYLQAQGHSWSESSPSANPLCVVATLANLRVICLQVAEKGAWIERRHRNRIAEIIGLVSNLKAELDDVQAEDEEKY